jgi:hypothetical protein
MESAAVTSRSANSRSWMPRSWTSRPWRPGRRPDSLRPYILSAVLGLAAVGSIALAGPRSGDKKVNVAGSTELRGSVPTAAARPPVPPKRPDGLPTFARVLGPAGTGDSRAFVAAVYPGLGYQEGAIAVAPVSPRLTPSAGAPARSEILALPATDWDRLAEVAGSVVARGTRDLPVATGSIDHRPVVPRKPEVDDGEPEAFKVPSRFFREKTVAPHTNPDFDVKVNDRTTIGVFGDLSPAAKVDPRNIDVRKDVGAGVTLQYKFQSR